MAVKNCTTIGEYFFLRNKVVDSQISKNLHVFAAMIFHVQEISDITRGANYFGKCLVIAADIMQDDV